MGGGPRISTGDDSKQDYGTPEDFLAPVVARFGPIVFDLAAHRLNKKHERYFAPTEFVEKFDPKKPFDADVLCASLVRRGAVELEAKRAIATVVQANQKCEFRVLNHDTKPYALDAFRHSWADLSRKFRAPDGRLGILWLNCEFSDIEPWASRCRAESERGANILLLTPAAVGSNWYRDHVAGHADVYELNGRLCFDGKNVFPKDCILSHFFPKDHSASESMVAKHVWEWRNNKIWQSWKGREA